MNGTDKQIEFATKIINSLASLTPTQPSLVNLSDLPANDQPAAHRANSMAKTRFNDETAAMHAAKTLQIIAAGNLDKAGEYADSLTDQQAEYISKVMACMDGQALDAGRVISQMKSLFYRLCSESA